jgi:hypothetical protein
MHPSRASLIAFCDAEAGTASSRRIASHLAKCGRCREQLERIKREKDDLAAGVAVPAVEGRQDLAALRAAIAAWREGRNGAAAAELRARLRGQLETYFGARAAAVADCPDIREEELFGKASEMIEIFLGPGAAEAARDDIFRGVDWAKAAEETCR